MMAKTHFEDTGHTPSAEDLTNAIMQAAESGNTVRRGRYKARRGRIEGVEIITVRAAQSSKVVLQIPIGAVPELVALLSGDEHE